MLLTKVKQQIQEQALIQPGDVVLVGASGGRDSMALLHCLYHLQTALSFTVVAAHFHHGLRGVEADQDQALVAAFCQERQIPFLSTQMNIAALAKGKNIEAVGRTYRYQWLHQMGQTYAPQPYKIATGHHLEDQAETILLHLFRGCGMQGLQGILPRSGAVIRPFLNFPRAELEDYIQREHIPYRDDASNFSTIYTRNKLRIELWPKLQAINPHLAERLNDTAQICQAENNLLQTMARQKFDTMLQMESSGASLPIKQLQQEHIAMQRRLIRLLWQTVQNQLFPNATPSTELSHQQTEAILQLLPQKQLSLPQEVYAKQEQGKIYIGKLSEEKNSRHFLQPIPLSLGSTHLYPLPWLIQAQQWQPKAKNNQALDTLVIPAALLPKLCWRTRLPGDYILLPGIAGKKKLKNFFIDLKIPAEQRNQIPLLCCGQEVLWLPGIRKSGSRLLALERNADKIQLQAIYQKID